MRVALSKAAFEADIVSRFGAAYTQLRPAPGVMSTGIKEIDSIFGGLPRGALTEIFGPPSSGRTSLMLATLARAAEDKEACALIDTSDVFDPVAAAGTEMNLDQLLWVCCGGNIEHAFKATDLLLQGGGFGLLLLDLGDVAGKDVRRIISSWWYRFRRAVENTPTALVVIASTSCVRSCAALALEMSKDADVWSSTDQAITADPMSPVATKAFWQTNTHTHIFTEINSRLDRHRPLHTAQRSAYFNAKI